VTAGPIIVETAGEGWYVDGVYLADLGTLMEPRDGWDDTPPTRGDNAILLGQDGVGWREKLFDVGRKTITMGIHGARWDGNQWLVPPAGSAQRALYEANLDALLRLLGRRDRPLLVERVYPDGSKRRARCEVTDSITPATAGNSFGQVQVTLAVLGAFWEDVEELVSRLPYDIAGPGTQRLEVYSLRGQTASCADAEVTVHGACSTVSIVDETTGRGFSYGALGPTEDLVVQQGGRFSATVSAVSVITDVTFSGPTLLKISPAPSPVEGPALLVTATGAGADFRVTVRSRGKYLR
jgi:hypothetical protein